MTRWRTVIVELSLGTAAAYVNLKSEAGETALHIAAETGNYSVASSIAPNCALQQICIPWLSLLVEPSLHRLDSGGIFSRQLMFVSKQFSFSASTQWNFIPWYLFVESFHFSENETPDPRAMIPRRDIKEWKSTADATSVIEWNLDVSSLWNHCTGWRAWGAMIPRRDIMEQNSTAERSGAKLSLSSNINCLKNMSPPSCPKCNDDSTRRDNQGMKFHLISRIWQHWKQEKEDYSDSSSFPLGKWDPNFSLSLNPMKILLQNGADFKRQIQKRQESIMLYLAVERGHVERATLLLRSGATVDIDQDCHLEPVAATLIGRNNDFADKEEVVSTTDTNPRNNHASILTMSDFRKSEMGI